MVFMLIRSFDNASALLPKWTGDPRIWVVATSAMKMNILVNHPYLSVYFHSPHDHYTSYQVTH